MAEVSVIVPARNSASTISRALAAIAAQELDRPYEVIVVDDGSTDDTAAVARRAPGGATVLSQPPLGPAAARNRGAAAARGSVLAFTDADCIPTPGWLAEGTRALGRGTDLVQGAVLPEPDARRGPFDHTIWVVGESGLYETANLLVTRELFERLGGFESWLEPTIGKALAEDVWFGWRARRAGARTAFCERALVHHAVLPRGVVGFVAERRRLAYFPLLTAKMPELRDQLFFARYFLTRRSAAFDAALLGMAWAARRSSALPLLLTLPYARQLRNTALAWGRRRAPVVALAELTADAVGFVSLVRGSTRSRSPLL